MQQQRRKYYKYGQISVNNVLIEEYDGDSSIGMSIINSDHVGCGLVRMETIDNTEKHFKSLIIVWTSDLGPSEHLTN